LILGSGTTGVGVYQLSGTGQLTSNGAETVGFNGTGTFAQSGASTHTANFGLTLGDGTGSTGAYAMSGGTLLVSNGGLASMNLGNNGTGTFTQSGGTVSLLFGLNPTDLNIGSNTGGTGVYNLNGGTLNVAGRISVGPTGTGTLNQTAGTINCNGFGVAGNGGTGTYLIGAGATLNTGTNSFDVNLGGSVFQTGGRITVGQFFIDISTLPEMAISSGYFRLSGGTLEVNAVDGIVAGGSFEQVGGLHTVHGLVLIGDGTNTVTSTYFLSGGTFQQSKLTTILGASTGSWNLVAGGVLAGSNGFLIADAHCAGGSVTGTLHNQGTFAFESGTFTAQLQNDGTFILNGNTITNILASNNDLGVFNGGGTITGALSNRGIVNTAGMLAVGTLNNFGQINIGTNSALIAPAGTNQATGQISISHGALIGTGSITNLGTISGGGTISLPITQNGGMIRADDPTTPLSIGSISITFPASQLLVAPGCTMRLNNNLVNTATITLQGSGALLMGNGSISNFGIISGPGQINNTLTNGGTIRNSSGELLLAGNGNTNNSNGTISATNGATITYSNGLVTNVGTILLTSGAFNNNGVAMGNVGTISGRGSISAGTITSNGTIVLSGGTTDFFAPLTNTNRATVTGDSLATFYAPVDTSAGTLNVNLGSTAVFLGPVTGAGHIAGAGVKDFEGGASGPIATLTGTTVVGIDGNLNASFIRDNTLSVVGKAAIAPAGTPALVSRLNTLQIDGTPDNWSGVLDMSDNDLILDYGGVTPIATVANQIKTGFANGAWTGKGITSASAASASPAHPTALGYADASTLAVSTFDGQSIDATTIVIRYTYQGDANLDGVVNALDFNLLATSFGAASGKFWSQADFNYDGATNSLDFNALAINFNLALPSPPLGTLVPEPASGLLALASALLLRRRRMHHPAEALHRACGS
jgi:hypothetical protein